MRRAKAAGRVGISVGYWLLLLATHLFHVQGVSFFFLLVISIPSYLSPLLSVFPYLLQRIVMGNLGYCRLYYLDLALSLFFFPCQMRYYFPKYPLFYFSYFLFLKYLTFLGDLFRFFFSLFLGSFLDWDGTEWKLGRWRRVLGRFESVCLGYWIKWNSEQIYIYWFL